MKQIILGDLHFGVKSFDLEFFENQKKLFTEQIIPYMQENNIKRIYQVGDFFDNRKMIDINFLNEVVEFLNSLQILVPDIEIICLLGNHDIYYRDSLEVSLIKIIAKKVNFITVFDEPTMINNIQLFPWLVDGYLEKEDIRGEIILGHFEIKNFEMVRGHSCDDGLDIDLFDDKMVLSGHFHLRGSRNNINYIGTPYQITWGDFGDRRGFYVLDNITKELEFIENKSSTIFVKIIFNSNESILVKVFDDLEFGFSLEEFKTFIRENIDLLKNSNLKIIVFSDGFEEFLDSIKEEKIKYNFVNNIELKELREQSSSDINMSSFDASEFIEQFIAKSNLTDKERLKIKFKEIMESLKEKQIQIS